MNENADVRTYSLQASGTGRMFWLFGAEDAHALPEGYLPDHGIEGDLEGLVVVPEGLMPSPGFRTGRYITPVIEASPFDWLVPWWNADIAGEGSLEVFLQTETEGIWTEWYSLGLWSSRPATASRTGESVRVDTDTLVLSAACSRYRMKLVLSTGSGGTGMVLLRRAGVVSRMKSSPRTLPRTHFLRECMVEMPAVSQMTEHASIRDRICSPACVSMALHLHGTALPLPFVAADCYDHGAEIYGNWAFNVATLWKHGVQARIDYFHSMEEAAGELLSGNPLVASIRFEVGELSGSPIPRTNGHLVLLCGLRRRGNGSWQVMVQDPAAAAKGEVQRLYDLAEFDRAWTGVAYVVEGPRAKYRWRASRKK
jgi:hypothetical protein